MIHFIIEAAREHLVAAVAASTNMLVGVFVGLASVVGAEVPDAVLTGGLLFVLATFTSIAGWALVLVVKLSQTVARNETDLADHERRLERLESPR